MYRDPDKAHHGRWGFRNNHPHEVHGLAGFLRWVWQRRQIRVEPRRFPLVANDPEFLRCNRSAATLTWIGHATFLLQYRGLNVLTDPHLTERASPFSWIGPVRTTPPGLTVDDLPPIDVLVISHNHYDHLDRETLLEIRRRQVLEPPWVFAPLGLGARLERWGLERVVELDWWESHECSGCTVRAVPVQHFSARTGVDRYRSLWAGWVLEQPGLRFFFAGDGGYSPDFREIRRRVGPMDLSALPIGAYEPRWFMRAVHMSPEEAVRAHLDLDSRLSVGMHWGTFVLTDEPQDEPPRRLATARAERGVPPESFVVMRHGETRRLEPPVLSSRSALWNNRKPTPVSSS